jgi:hypothetical protein
LLGKEYGAAAGAKDGHPWCEAEMKSSEHAATNWTRSVIMAGALISWADLILLSSRHWAEMTPRTHILAIMFLVMYPFPCVQMFVPRQTPALMALITYILLSFATKFMFM